MSVPHFCRHIEVMEGPVGFWTVVWYCSCGLTHFWLLTQEELDLGISLWGNLRDRRKEVDRTVLEEDFAQQDEDS